MKLQAERGTGFWGVKWGSRHGPGKKEGCSILSFPSSLTADIGAHPSGSLSCGVEGLSRMEMCLVLGNKGLWSCAFHQASGSGVGLCGDSKCLWILADSQTPAALRGWWGSSGQIQVCGEGLFHLPRIFCL